MTDFNIRSESVDVEQIMTQIRTRIREKRGVDYTEDQVRELASVRLEKFLDPKNLRSDLLEQFRRSRPAIQDDPPPVHAPFEFNDETLFASHRGPLRFIRKLLKPILKLFFNPNTLNQILHTQAQFNVDLLKREQRRKIEFDRSRAEWNALYYEVLHNLVLETTRNSIELKNLKMRVEALASRLDFSERRVRALEGVVQYRPEAFRSRDRKRMDDAPSVEEPDPTLVPTGEGSPHSQAGGTALLSADGRRRRRRRRGRRSADRTLGPGSAEGTPTQDAAFTDDADLSAGSDTEGADFVESDSESERPDDGTDEGELNDGGGDGGDLRVPQRPAGSTDPNAQ